MIIILSPTKQMYTKNAMPPLTIPYFRDSSARLLEVLRQLSVQDIQRLMKVNEKIAIENVDRFKHISFDLQGTPAFTTYHGLQFKHMHMETFTEDNWCYVKEHLRILSGFYGLLHPFDSIFPYRLEMQCKLAVHENADIYAFWKDTIAQELKKEVSSHSDKRILNLASKEYGKVVLPFLEHDVVSVVFYKMKDGKLKSESTQVKMARGAMVNYLVKHSVRNIDEVKCFSEHGYSYSEVLSDSHEYVFVKDVDI